MRIDVTLNLPCIESPFTLRATRLTPAGTLTVNSTLTSLFLTLIMPCLPGPQGISLDWIHGAKRDTAIVRNHCNAHIRRIVAMPGFDRIHFDHSRHRPARLGSTLPRQMKLS